MKDNQDHDERESKESKEGQSRNGAEGWREQWSMPQEGNEGIARPEFQERRIQEEEEDRMRVDMYTPESPAMDAPMTPGAIREDDAVMEI